MTPDPHRAEGVRDMVPRQNRRLHGEALFSLSQSQRRLAHRVRREAIEAEVADNYRRYADSITEARRLWRDAKFYLAYARRELDRA